MMEDVEQWIEELLGPDKENRILCPVPECEGLSLSSRKMFHRHWSGYHFPDIIMFRCVVRECSYCSPRADKVKEHMKKQHQTAFPHPEDLKAAGKHLPWRQETNSKFINPRNLQPPIPIHFKTPAEPKQHQQPQPLQQQQPQQHQQQQQQQHQQPQHQQQQQQHQQPQHQQQHHNHSNINNSSNNINNHNNNNLKR